MSIDRKFTKKFSEYVEDSELAEEIPIELLSKDVKISDLELEALPALSIKETEGDLLKGQKLQITARGLSNGLRAKEDSMVLFGNDKKNEKDEYINDFILNTKDSYKTNTIFMIYYRRDINDYFLKMILEGDEKYFCFVLLSEPHAIDEKCVFSVLNYNFKVTIEDKVNCVIEYEYKNNTSSFTFKNKNKIVIGRKNDCDLNINEDGFSRIQTTVFYDQSKEKWFLRDGTDGKTSLSGTWLYVESYYHLRATNKLKIGESSIDIDVYDVQNN